MIEALIEDATGQVRAKQAKVTHRKLKQGQWIETIQYFQSLTITRMRFG